MCGLALMCAAALGRSCRRRPLLQLAKRDAPRGDGGLFADFGNKTGTARPDAGRGLHVRLQGVSGRRRSRDRSRQFFSVGP